MSQGHSSETKNQERDDIVESSDTMLHENSPASANPEAPVEQPQTFEQSLPDAPLSQSPAPPETHLPSSAAHTMPHRSTPEPRIHPTGGKPSDSGHPALPSKKRRPQSDTFHPSTPSVTRTANSAIQDDPMSDSEASEPAEPQDRLGTFEWTELQQRYHEAMGHFDNEEKKILHNFNELSQVCERTSVRRLLTNSVKVLRCVGTGWISP
jgi:hypothetical protein